MRNRGKRNTLKLQLSGFEELITKLDELGGNIETVVEDALQQAGETIGDDTIEAIGKGIFQRKNILRRRNRKVCYKEP